MQLIDVFGNSPRLALIDENMGDAEFSGSRDDVRFTEVEFRYE